MTQGIQQVVVDRVRDAIQIPNNLGAAAFSEGRYHDAERHYARAVAALQHDEDHLAPALYENLGFARFNLGRHRPASRALLRALDGDPTSRPEAARFAILALLSDGKKGRALALLSAYEHAFGPHPDGVRSHHPTP